MSFQPGARIGVYEIGAPLGQAEFNPHWARDGRAVYYLQGADVLSVSIEASGGLAAAKPRRLFGQQLALQFDSQQYFDVAPDGRLLMLRAANDRPSVPELRVVLNWFADLRRPR